LHVAAEQLDTVLVATVRGLLRLSDAVLEPDGATDQRLDENAREEECEHACDGADQKAVRNDSLLHGSVAGESEQMASVVEEFVGVGVAAEDRRRALVHADAVHHQQGQDGAGQPRRRADPGQVNSRRP
jgi:hypothetical protein